MNYQNIYNQIIERAKNRKLEGYKEKHHIIPKCLGGDNSKKNLVELTAREHFLCHRLLCEVYPNNEKLLWALWLMAIGKQKRKNTEPYKVSSREYERVKLIFVEKQKQKKVPQEHKDKVSKANSEEVSQYDMAGVWLRDFDSVMEAERYINNIPEAHWSELSDNIGACCRLKQKSAYGYIWRYKKDSLDLSKYIGADNKKQGKKIIDPKTGNIFKSVKEAQTVLKISNWRIYQMLKEQKLKYE
jgi:hypothetical protein